MTVSTVPRSGPVYVQGRQGGTFQEFDIPTNPDCSNICVGPDNALWFTTENPGALLGRISLVGEVTMISLPIGNCGGICAGPDGNIWFNDFTNSRVCRFNPVTATLSRFSVAGSG